MTTSTMTPAPFMKRIAILLSVTLIAGFSQGMLLPLLAISLEQQGVSAQSNGLNSMALYLGTFGMMFLIEKPIRRFGFKSGIIAGIVTAGLATLLFPLTSALWVWVLLRVLVGIGDSLLHYCAQLWIVSSSPATRRGKFISLYGMAYGIGFSIGPLGINLSSWGHFAPYALNALLFVVVLGFVFTVRNEHPEKHVATERTGNRFAFVYRAAWYALLPAVLYGLLESTMNSNFPLYGLRIGINRETISLLLPALGVGSLLLMLPLGSLSDRYDRKRILICCAASAGILFFAVPIVGNAVVPLFILLMLIGGLIGSFFSLGLAYCADLLPKSILPTANVIASVHFSLGSLLGPGIGGYAMQNISVNSMFIMLGGAFVLFASIGLFARQTKAVQ